MRVDFHLDGVDDAPRQEKREESNLSSTNDLTTAVSSAASAKLPERAVWLLVGYGLAKFNLRVWAREFWVQACGAEHKGLFLSVVTLILTFYMVCVFAPMNAVAEWDTRWRGGSSSGRRASGVPRAR
eukprot:g1267.t1